MDPTLVTHSSPGDAADLLGALQRRWPVPAYDPGRGYPTVATDGLELVDVLSLGERHAVAVTRDGDLAAAARPLVRDDRGWRVAGPGDGTAGELLAALSGSTRVLSGAFGGSWDDTRVRDVGTEQAMAADQTNISVVVGDAIVKWRVAAHAAGGRGLRIRRHLQANGFAEVPPLLGALTWTDGGHETVLADVDHLLPGAVDGWDHALSLLVPYAEGRADAPPLGATLGALTARLHAALVQPSTWVGTPAVAAGAEHVRAWRAAADAAIEAAIAIDAHDRAVVANARPWLERAVADLGTIEQAVCIPIHGDLHIGQLVAWNEGLAVIDFDGPPHAGRGASFELGRHPAARDVAQLVVSLDLLAVAADRQTDGRARARLSAWARDARASFIEHYRAEAERADAGAMLEERLLPPFMAEQLCRELLYAEAALPRWRYAPIGALDWLHEGSRR